jgi:hypothetical protein
LSLYLGESLSEDDGGIGVFFGGEEGLAVEKTQGDAVRIVVDGLFGQEEGLVILAFGEEFGDTIEVAVDGGLLLVGPGFFLLHSLPDIPKAVGIRFVLVDGTVGIEIHRVSAVVIVVVRGIAVPVIRVIVIIVVRIVVPVVREGEIGEVPVSPVSVMTVSVMAGSVMVIAAAG